MYSSGVPQSIKCNLARLHVSHQLVVSLFVHYEFYDCVNCVEGACPPLFGLEEEDVA